MGQLDGVDDRLAVPEPFDMRTAHAILGRQVRVAASEERAVDGAIVQLGELAIDEARCRVRWRGVMVGLTKRDRDLLARMAGEPGHVWTYAQLHAAVWGDRFIGDPAAVNAAIKRLRRKLRDAGVDVRIESVRGVGYQLVLDEPST